MNFLLKRGGLAAGIVAVSATAIVVCAAAGSEAQRRAAQEHCPAGALILPGNGVARAAKAALASAAADYPTLKTTGAVVVSARRATSAGPRGVQVARECGTRARARTAVVQLRFPRMAPSASLAEGVVDVSRFSNGYRVWAVVH